MVTTISFYMKHYSSVVISISLAMIISSLGMSSTAFGGTYDEFVRKPRPKISDLCKQTAHTTKSAAQKSLDACIKDKALIEAYLMKAEPLLADARFRFVGVYFDEGEIKNVTENALQIIETLESKHSAELKALKSTKLFKGLDELFATYRSANKQEISNKISELVSKDGAVDNFKKIIVNLKGFDTDTPTSGYFDQELACKISRDIWGSSNAKNPLLVDAGNISKCKALTSELTGGVAVIKDLCTVNPTSMDRNPLCNRDTKIKNFPTYTAVFNTDFEKKDGNIVFTPDEKLGDFLRRLQNTDHHPCSLPPNDCKKVDQFIIRAKMLTLALKEVTGRLAQSVTLIESLNKVIADLDNIAKQPSTITNGVHIVKAFVRPYRKRFTDRTSCNATNDLRVYCERILTTKYYCTTPGSTDQSKRYFERKETETCASKGAVNASPATRSLLIPIKEASDREFCRMPQVSYRDFCGGIHPTPYRELELVVLYNCDDSKTAESEAEGRSETREGENMLLSCTDNAVSSEHAEHLELHKTKGWH